MITRRDFVHYSVTSGGSLLVLTGLPSCQSRKKPESIITSEQSLKTLYLEVPTDNRFILTFDKAEMGQGVITGQATLFGEEADIDPRRFIMKPAMADERYGSFMGQMLTGGSTSTPDRFELLRTLAAGYRHRVRFAAANEWKIPISEVETNDGFVYHRKTKKRLPYAYFNTAVAALKDDVPDPVPLKPKSKWRYIGKFDHSLDAEEKSTGSTDFGLDFSLKGMKTAILIRSPAFKGKLKSYDQKTIESMEYVIKTVETTRGVAIICDSYWRCLKVKNGLRPDMFVWDNSEASLVNSGDLFSQYRNALKGEKPSVNPGQKLVSAEYSLPFLNHAPMEPQNAVAWKQKDRFDMWVPSQAATFPKTYIQDHSHFESDQIYVHNAKYLGGGFGRRAQIDFVIEVFEIAMKVDFPVKLVWSREDDIQHSPLRPMSVHQFHAVIDKGVVSWSQQIAAQSIAQNHTSDLFPIIFPKWIAGSVGTMMDWAGAVPMAKEGSEQPYDLPYDISAEEQKSSIPVTFWRSVGHSHNGFVVESFLDEVAHELNKDPLDFRLNLLSKDLRAKRVTEKVAEMAGWKERQPTNRRALGLAYHFSFNTHCAQIADVEIDQGQIKIHQVWAVVDSGIIVNPDIVKKQIESGIIFGITAALFGKIEFKNGSIVQSNFHDYPLLKLDASPKIDVGIIESDVPATGVGEPGLPPIAAAIGNGIFRATGKRYRDLPFALS